MLQLQILVELLILLNSFLINCLAFGSSLEINTANTFEKDLLNFIVDLLDCHSFHSSYFLILRVK